MRRMKNIHPGKVLKEEFLVPLNVMGYRLSRLTGLSQARHGQLIKGKRSITSETALILGKVLRVLVEFWMNLQMLYDIEETSRVFEKDIIRLHPIGASAA